MVDFNLSLEDLKETLNCIYNTKLIIKTPILRHVGSIFNLNDKNYELCFKLESMQTSGSFKIRGVVNKILDFRIFLTISQNNPEYFMESIWNGILLFISSKSSAMNQEISKGIKLAPFPEIRSRRCACQPFSSLRRSE